ncbi:hypothetical protein PISMIDRAFT_12796 [Pisolithus microcarpus 441]|uniref:Uncharacterized protein n=1 Tax=Pisolithus microcarpus 441 TaxID=765257 RepID=A0A0C9YVB1_9AGAM|nr:hypothetical protein PISMIDRAFT_12796 [Pisolithus microcarpus 441]
MLEASSSSREERLFASNVRCNASSSAKEVVGVRDRVAEDGASFGARDVIMIQRKTARHLEYTHHSRH